MADITDLTTQVAHILKKYGLKTVADMPTTGTVPNLAQVARAVSQSLDSLVSTSWVAMASRSQLLDYLTTGKSPDGVKAPVEAKPRAAGATIPKGGATAIKNPPVPPAAMPSAVPVVPDPPKGTVADMDAIKKFITNEVDRQLTAHTPSGIPDKVKAELEEVKGDIDTLRGDLQETKDASEAVANKALAGVADMENKVAETLKKAEEASNDARAAAARAASAPAAMAAAGAMNEDNVRRIAEEIARTAIAATIAPRMGDPSSATPTPSAAPVTAATGSLPPLRRPGGGAKAPTSTAFVEGILAKAMGDDPVTAYLDTFCHPGAANKPVLICGEAGAGKTYGARVQGRQFDRQHEIGLHASTEAVDLLGNPRVDGGWMDGPLSAAFRDAAAGFNTQLRLDEFYRPANQARSILLTCTSPFTDLDGNKFYVLATGRQLKHATLDDVYTQEVIYAPVHKLAIVGTTNVGSQYDVSEGDPAEKRRFARVQLDVTEPLLMRILASCLLARPDLSPMHERILKGLIAFWKGAAELMRNAMIEVMPTASTMAEAIEHPASKDMKSFTRIFLMLGQNVWVGTDMDGKPAAEQAKAVEELLVKSLA